MSAETSTVGLREMTRRPPAPLSFLSLLLGIDANNEPVVTLGAGSFPVRSRDAVGSLRRGEGGEGERARRSGDGECCTRVTRPPPSSSPESSSLPEP